jgi:hypothetical protein
MAIIHGSEISVSVVEETYGLRVSAVGLMATHRYPADKYGFHSGEWKPLTRMLILPGKNPGEELKEVFEFVEQSAAGHIYLGPVRVTTDGDTVLAEGGELALKFSQEFPKGEFLEFLAECQELNPQGAKPEGCPWMGGPTVQVGVNPDGWPQVTIWEEGNSSQIDPYHGPIGHVRVHFSRDPETGLMHIFYRAPRMPGTGSEYPVHGRGVIESDELIAFLRNESFEIQDPDQESSLILDRGSWEVLDWSGPRNVFVEGPRMGSAEQLGELLSPLITMADLTDQSAA